MQEGLLLHPYIFTSLNIFKLLYPPQSWHAMLANLPE